jgi:probable rRNA maturation factor
MDIQIASLGARINPSLPLSRFELRDLLRGIVSSCGVCGTGLELSCVRDGEMAEYNERFMHCPGPTNVLSFPSGTLQEDGFLGQIVLGVETLDREARLYGQDPEEHLVRLLAHAVLHLAGHEHGETMEALTERAVADWRKGRKIRR